MQFSYPVISFELYNQIYNSNRVSNLDNGHTILIPEIHYNELIQKDDYFENNCVNYFKIYNLIKNDEDANIFEELFTIFGKCSFVEENHIVLPEWAIQKLKLKIFDIAQVNLMEYIEDITFLKIQGENSSYAKLLDIKEVFEKELSKCISTSVGDSIIFNHFDEHLNQEIKVVFKVLEIKNEFDENLNYGSLRDTEVKVEFDIPLDILEEQEKERLRQIQLAEEEERNYQLELENKKQRLIEEAKRKQLMEDERRGFKGSGHSLKEGDEKILTREEALRLMEERFKNS